MIPLMMVRKAIQIFIKNCREEDQPVSLQKQSTQSVPNNHFIVPPVSVDSKKAIVFENTKGCMDAIHGLSALIKIKHYSPKTLWAYTHWTKKFQGFAHNKDIQSLSSVEVKDLCNI
ncbi:hypothetical protein KsCSTR_08370 [Candidatus Kuenenia stuttgartiensis]|jgi:hypothetical protein|uniref:Uncharacterized protein n=1 Tax=Kuenenia stuttgartiensis TaxID=174633 RepID=Q1PZA1_KUEST|nr:MULTISPECIES: hypothetical protein [Kuenenia]MBW7942063.1 hypothetical protein [Candidatus Kuenenia stuttgartiensis]MBZ0190180.1 hypothetical protein [Candidatus Kuenenia stuttgartiensis]MCL4725812.1 hypothetical protein [Candidatus Kuenenia stuttgartiensis]MCZ7623837.1 hypothetical protein [Candidatus Kuenenia sp.]QII10216.1 hypothetical protein KsCSTR_08370 [Candidatus Kuenenia stuttgartiensis]